LRVIYGDDGFFFRRYHAEAGDDPAASVPPWDPADGSRTVTFSKAMALPSVIERLLGPVSAAAASLQFREKQWFHFDPATGAACVRSNPELVNPRSDSFKTELAVHLRPLATDRARCAMSATLRVTAVGTWALQPVVEKMMEHRASAIFREWVRYADTFLTENYGGPYNADRPLPKLGLLKGFGEGSRPSWEDRARRGHAHPEITVTGGAAPTLTTTTTPLTAARLAARDGIVGGVNIDGVAGANTLRRQESLAATATAGTSAAAAMEDAFEDADFDDAKSFVSAASFMSATSNQSSWSSRSHGGGVGGGGGENAGANGDATSSAERVHSMGGTGVVDAEVGSSGGGGGSRVSRVAEGVGAHTGRGAGLTNGGANDTRPLSTSASPPPPRADDVYANSWFMQTVLKDLGCLRAAAREQREVMSALEENICAVRTESTALRTEVRRLLLGVAGSGGGVGAPGGGGGGAGRRPVTPAVPASGAWFPIHGAHRADSHAYHTGQGAGDGWGWFGGGGGPGSYVWWTMAAGCGVGVGYAFFKVMLPRG
jgi:hypothetical protein